MDAPEDGDAGQRPQPRSPLQQRLHDGFRDDRRYLSRMVAAAQDERSARVEAVLELKHDLDASAARAEAHSTLLAERDQAARMQQARTHQELLNQGKNPYEVARRRVVKREARKERSRLERRLQTREAKLLARLEAERHATRRKEKVEAANQAFERKYQREMGRAAVEERTHAYLVARTGRETLDPTGKLVRVYPSQKTVIKDNSFGLGRSAVITSEHRQRVIAKVLAKPAHRGTEPSALLLPHPRSSPQSATKQRDVVASSSARTDDAEPSSPQVTARLAMPPLVATAPGQDLRSMNHALLSSVNSETKLPPLSGASGRRQESEKDTTETQTKARRQPKRSVLEERQLALARERQHDTLFSQPQVVWGKTFSGAAFLAEPAVLWFRDFEVGRALSLRFTLTNVSHTFNQFRLLPMDDAVRELFDITYDKPGRMSAGMSCSLRMSFTGVEPRDLDAFLPVAAPTGVVRVPVRCTCRKAVPELTQRNVRFVDVVAGERATVALTLANQGALPLEFRVRRLTSSSSEPSSDASETTEQIAKDPENGGQENEDVCAAAEQELETVDTAKGVDEDEPEAQGAIDAVGDSPDDGEAASGAPADVQEAVTEIVEPVALRSPPASRKASRVSSRMATTRSTGFETEALIASPDGLGSNQEQEEDGFEPLSAEEQTLLTQASEMTQFKPEGADAPIRFTRRGVVAPYSSSSVSFTFAPAAAMTLANQRFLVEFPTAAANSPERKRLAAIPVQVSAVAAQVPVFAARRRLDFRCCAYGKLYRHQVTLCNRGKVALKLQVQVPTALAGCLEFHPSFGFVQAASVASGVGQFPVQVKFRPQERMWPRLERAGLGSRALGMLAVPVQVVVPDQVVPVFFLLTARLTPTTLQLQLQHDQLQLTSDGLQMGGLQFGSCCVGHSVSHDLMLTNTARVPQRLGFTRLPEDVRVADTSAGVGLVLLPGETRSLRIVFEPSMAGALTAASGRGRPTLVLRSATFNHEYVLPCSGNGVTAMLTLSHSVIRLGATPLGQTQIGSVSVHNRSERQTLDLELRLPAEATKFLTLTPLVARLAPRESVRLELEFSPTEDLFALTQRCHFESLTPDSPEGEKVEIQTPAATSVQVETSLQTAIPPLWTSEDTQEDGSTSLLPWRTGVAAEERSCHHAWTILCFQRPSEGSTVVSKAPLQALEVRTTAVLPAVRPSPSLLDFGQVAIGQTLVRDLTLEAAPGSQDVLLRAQPLHVLGAFRLLGALRALPERGGKRILRVEFEPRTPLVYEDELALEAAASVSGVKLQIRLRGEGINPSLTLSPPDGRLDFQDVLARTRSVRELILANDSAFPLAFSIVAWQDDGEDDEDASTSTGLPVFTFSPREATIPAEGSVSILAAFQPDHQRPTHYKQQFRVQVPNESERHLLTLSGRCWENQLYVFAPDAMPTKLTRRPSTGVGKTENSGTPKKPALVAPPPVEDAFDLPPSVALSQLPSSLLGAELPVSGLRKPPSTIVLTFQGDESVPSTSQSHENEDEEGDAAETDGETGGERGRATQTLFVGSTAPSGASSGAFDDVTAAASAAGNAGSAGSFELLLDAAAPHAKLFTLEPMRGAVAAGQQLAVQVTYQPPIPAAVSATGSDAATSARSGGGSGRPGSGASVRAVVPRRRTELEVAQWIQVRVQCVLKGGSLWRSLPPPAAAAPSKSTADAADTRVVSVLLRARLQT